MPSGIDISYLVWHIDHWLVIWIDYWHAIFLACGSSCPVRIRGIITRRNWVVKVGKIVRLGLSISAGQIRSGSG